MDVVHFVLIGPLAVAHFPAVNGLGVPEEDEVYQPAEHQPEFAVAQAPAAGRQGFVCPAPADERVEKLETAGACVSDEQSSLYRQVKEELMLAEINKF